MRTLPKNEVLEELKEGKKLLYDTLDKTLENVQITKDELKELKRRLEGNPDFVIERETQFYNIRKKMHVVLGEADLHAKLDTAIEFLEEILSTRQ